MEYSAQVLEYKCPCCGTGLKFSEDSQNMTCEHCDNSFELETVNAFNEAKFCAECDDRYDDADLK